MRLLAKSSLLCLLIAVCVQPSIAATLFRDSQFNVKVARNVQYGTGEVRQPQAVKRPLYPDINPPHFRAVADMWGTMGPRVKWIRKSGPPLLIIHGKEDETITVSAAEQIEAQAKQVGLTHETFLIDGMGHGVPLNLEVDGKTLLQHLVDFFYKQIAPARRISTDPRTEPRARSVQQANFPGT